MGGKEGLQEKTEQYQGGGGKNTHGTHAHMCAHI